MSVGIEASTAGIPSIDFLAFAKALVYVMLSFMSESRNGV